MVKFITVLAVSLILNQSFAADVMTAELTAYCDCVKCCGDFPGKIRGQTASGTMATANNTLAAPKNIPFGTIVYIVKNGVKTRLGVVEDRGGAIKTKADGTIRIDVFHNSHNEALVFGRQKAVKIVLQMP